MLLIKTKKERIVKLTGYEDKSCSHSYKYYSVPPACKEQVSRGKFRHCEKCGNLQRRGFAKGDTNKWFNSGGIAPPEFDVKLIIKPEKEYKYVQ